MQITRSVLAIGILALLASASLEAQQNGTLTGVVTDQVGKAIPNTAVEVRNESTGASRSVVADNDGKFSVPDLAPDALYEMRRKFGMLFQFGALFTDMSVFENIAFPMREHTELPEELIRDLVLMKLHAVGLRGAAQLMPGELSGGMARRVALARAIALDPLLVLYDEPFAGLDPISLGVVGQLIRRLNDALAITSVVVTHDVYESLKIVDYLYFVSEGRIVASGTPAEIRASSDPFVRQFVDGAPDGPVPFHYPAPAYRAELFADVG